jgi:type IV pilus assembly protein PilA
MARSMLEDHRMTSRVRHRSKGDAGFTLVELGAVVTIIGILAVIAVVGYRKYILHSKITEAQNVISAIRIAQEDHRAERGTYADLGATYCPGNAGAADHKVGWDPECSGGGSHADPKWHSLPVHVSGAVQFKYATVAGTGAFAAPTDASFVKFHTPPAGHWYVVMARCDLDGQPTGDTQLVGSSFTNEIFSQNDGQ